MLTSSTVLNLALVDVDASLPIISQPISSKALTPRSSVLIHTVVLTSTFLLLTRIDRVALLLVIAQTIAMLALAPVESAELLFTDVVATAVVRGAAVCINAFSASRIDLHSRWAFTSMSTW